MTQDQINLMLGVLAGSPLVLYVVQQLFTRRTNKADALSKQEGVIKQVMDRADELYKEKLACEMTCDKLRGDVAFYLVTIADLEKQNAAKDGYIQGVKETNPLIKLEEQQKAALIGGRRVGDK